MRLSYHVFQFIPEAVNVHVGLPDPVHLVAGLVAVGQGQAQGEQEQGQGSHGQAWRTGCKTDVKVDCQKLHSFLFFYLGCSLFGEDNVKMQGILNVREYLYASRITFAPHMLHH